MKNLIGNLSRRGRLGAVALLVGAAFLLAPAGLVEEATAGNRRGRADMEPGPAGEGTDASGRVDFRSSPRGERVRLRLRNLEPRTDYEVRDSDTGEVLGRVRSNRRGRAKARLRSAGERALGGRALEVRRIGDADAVLGCEVPGDGNGIPGDGWEGGAGTFLSGWVGTGPDATVQVSLSMDSASFEGSDKSWESFSLVVFGPEVAGPVVLRIADGEGVLTTVATVEELKFDAPGMDGNDGREGMMHRMGGDGSSAGNDHGDPSGGDDWIGPPDWMPGSFFLWSAEGGDLPLGVETVSLLSGRAFEVTDAEGTVLLDGVLPDLEELVHDDLPEEEDPTGGDDGWGNGPR